jgi:predicted dehydrogenase
VIDPSFGVDATFAGVLRFDGDRLGIIDSSLRHANTQRYEIVGTEGRIIVERAFRPDTLPGVIRIVSRTSDSTEEVPAANQYGLQADHFARSVRAGRLLPPAEDGVAQAAVVEALYASAGAGRSVSVGAAAMRDRP